MCAKYTYIYMYIYICTYICIYIYRERENIKKKQIKYPHVYKNACHRMHYSDTISILSFASYNLCFSTHGVQKLLRETICLKSSKYHLNIIQTSPNHHTNIIQK